MTYNWDLYGQPPRIYWRVRDTGGFCNRPVDGCAESAEAATMAAQAAIRERGHEPGRGRRRRPY